MSTEQERAEYSKRRGRQAANISDPAARRRYIAAQGDRESRLMREYGSIDAGERAIDKFSGERVGRSMRRSKGRRR